MISSLLLSFCSPCFSLHPFFIITLFSSLFLVLFVIPSMFLLSQSLCLAYDVLQFNLRPLWVVVAALLMVESAGTRQKEGKVESGGKKRQRSRSLSPSPLRLHPLPGKYGIWLAQVCCTFSVWWCCLWPTAGANLNNKQELKTHK